MLREVGFLVCLAWNILPASAERKEDLGQYVRLLTDELACNFNNMTFCRLNNNGGWSFKQSLLELVQQLTTESNPHPQLPPQPSQTRQHFACADWGEVSGRSHTDSRPAGRQHLATLEAVILPASSFRQRKEEEEGVVADGSAICLKLDVRLAADLGDDGSSSKLMVRFRSLTQTIKAPPAQPPPTLATVSAETAPTTTLEQKLAFLGRLAFRLLWQSSVVPPEEASAPLPPPPPPTHKWLHLTLPIAPHHIVPPSRGLLDSPLHFALIGQLGVCVDSLYFVRCHDSIARQASLSWAPNGSLDLSTTNSANAPTSSVSQGRPTPSDTLYTGAFLFVCLLVCLVTIVLVIVVVSALCGKRSGRRRRRRSSRWCSGSAKPARVLPEAALLRSPSISSLPGAAVHQRPIDELLHPAEVEERRVQLDKSSVLSSWQPVSRHALGPDSRVSAGDSKLASRGAPPRKTASKPKKDFGGCGVGGQPSNSAQRLSLLLSINEDNELVLVPPATATAPPARVVLRHPVEVNRHLAVTTAQAATRPLSPGSPTPSGAHPTATTTTAAVSSSSSTLRLSMAEAEATLQEMAASVIHLGETTAATPTSTSSASSSSASCSVGLPPLYEEAVQLLE